MKTPFQLVDEIRQNKNRYFIETDDAFNPVVMQKALSMQAANVCSLLSNTTNKWLYDLDNQQLMDIWKLLVPKTMAYIKWMAKTDKSAKKKTTEINDKINRVAVIFERSPTDIKNFIEFDNTFLDSFTEEKISIKQKVSVE